MNQLKWLDKFHDDETYCLSLGGLCSVNEVGIEINCNTLLEPSFLIKTSGSSSLPKWVVYSKNKLLKHAQLVNAHLSIDSSEIFGLMLPTFHVGGLGLVARSIVSRGKLQMLEEKWSARYGYEFLKNYEVSITSMVPTQLVDLIKGGYQSPESIKALVVGGGKLLPDIKNAAIDLGWPVYESYGMTETGSQIATGLYTEEGYLKLIDGWRVREGRGGVLEVKSDCLMTGYLQKDKGQYIFTDPKIDGWYRTNDKVDIKVVNGEVGLKFISRSDQLVKILGELVDVAILETQIVECVNSEVYIIVLEDQRRGAKLVPIVTCEENCKKVDALNLRGLEKLDSAVVVDAFPKNEMGKLKRSKLKEMVESIVFPRQ